MKILVLNAGSSSLKFSLFDGSPLQLMKHGLIEHLGESIEGKVKTHGDALREIEGTLQEAELATHLGDCDAVGHRVVHGGELFSEPTEINDIVIKQIATLTQLAPLHNPANLLPIKFLAKTYPNLKQVAVFDTAFHQTLPDYAFHYAIPNSLYQEHQIRRYGFHGTSHKYISHQMASVMELPDDEVHLISMHLGNGASICAIEHGESIDTSMGFTPLEGLVMGTRSGDCDPAIALYLIKQLGYSAEEVDEIFNKHSGLKGLCGESDMREVIDLASSDDPDAQLALDLFTYRINKIAGSYLAIMDELDALVFTGGIGEHSALIREMVLTNFSSRFGIEIDFEANDLAQGVTCITTPESEIQAWVIPTDEELEIAQQVIETL